MLGQRHAIVLVYTKCSTGWIYISCIYVRALSKVLQLTAFTKRLCHCIATQAVECANPKSKEHRAIDTTCRNCRRSLLFRHPPACNNFRAPTSTALSATTPCGRNGESASCRGATTLNMLESVKALDTSGPAISASSSNLKNKSVTQS